MDYSELLDHCEAWHEAEERLEGSLPASKKQWFDRISYKGIEDGMIVLSLSSDFFKDNAEKSCGDEIRNTIEAIAGEKVGVRFIVDSDSKPSVRKKAPARTQKAQEAVPASRNTTLNKAYSFDNFIAGDNSIFAFNAAKVIAQNPGLSYNPCLIYGGVGLGKTHLLH